MVQTSTPAHVKRPEQRTIHFLGTHLRRDTVIPQWFQASKAAAASDGHAVHCWVTAVICQLSRLKRIPHFLTQDELRRLFKVIRSKRDKAIFLVAYRHGLRASEIGLLQRADVDAKQGRISIHRLKGSIS